MFFVVRSNYSFNFTLGWIKYIVIVVIDSTRPVLQSSLYYSYSCLTRFLSKNCVCSEKDNEHNFLLRSSSSCDVRNTAIFGHPSFISSRLIMTHPCLVASSCISSKPLEAQFLFHWRRVWAKRTLSLACWCVQIYNTQYTSTVSTSMCPPVF